ncbi:nucleotidyltransferase family protein [Amaricoccus solimangrovi]|nr:nucleotidyltransferase family protein [Amaricoccus solimangrovi]
MTPFAELCLLIRVALGTEPDPAGALRAARLDPALLVPLAFEHRVAPFLGRLTEDPAIAPLLPEALADGFRFAAEANGTRNEALREELAEVLALLDAAGIEPLLLKGAGRLADGLLGPAGRFMQDLDLLVPASRIDEAAAALEAAGYAPLAEGPQLAEEHHHLPALWREGAPAAIELHRVAQPWHQPLLPTPRLFERSSPVVIGGRSARLPAPADALLHLVLHGQVNHRRLLSGGVLLSEVVEFALIARYHGPGVVAEARSGAGKAGLSFDAFLRLCELTAGTDPVPVGSFARFLARRALWLRDHPRARDPGRALAYAVEHAASLRHRPSVRRRFPGRFAERGFYASRWREIRSVFAR